ncbi:MAG: DegT/DnrJ/EryC1/StrS family aminotransferase [Patescibacteria group bacterium]|jgi:perosamine synthetase
MKKYPVAKPYITSEEINAVTRVLRSGMLSLGPVHVEFEKAFAKKMGSKYAVSVSSGTAGLHLAMIAAGVGPGDEVITAPFSFVASGNCVMYVGAKPVFVDIDPLTYNMDPKLIEKKITKKTKAILVVHIFGQSADMAPIMKIAKKHRLKVIEDACESVCATYKKKPVGTFGESAVFAFYPNKQMTTGEGGMLVTDSERVYKIAKSLANQGRGDDMQWLDHKYLGYNYRMDEMSAALGLAQLHKIDFLIGERRRIAALYDAELGSHPDLVLTPQVAPGNRHTYFVYVIQIANKKIPRDEVIRALKEKGIQTKPYLPSMHLFDFYKKQFGYRKGDYPVSESVSDSSLALPIFVGLTKRDIGYIAGTLRAVLQSYAK